MENNDSPRLHTVARFPERFPCTERGLRALIYASEDRVLPGGRVVKGNGLAKAGAIVRVGRRVFIDERAFFQWIAAQQKSATRGRVA